MDRVKDFINEARCVHGDHYDYSRIKCIPKSVENLEIVCPKHGVFFQRRANHLQGKGCKECGTERRRSLRLKTTEYFVSESRKVHGEKYDYTCSNYTGIFEKLTINCPEHGTFEQTAKSHMSGSGCPKCSKYTQRRGNVQSFIEESSQIHGGKYDYSKVVYSNVKQKVEIVCPDHGSFWQTFDNHMRNSRGCPACGKDASRLARIKDTEHFRRKAHNVHSGFYSYEKSSYIDQSTKLTITCPLHGDFEMTPSRHYSGGKCPGCYKDSAAEKALGDFVKTSKKVHKGKYDYSDVHLRNKRDRVVIICPVHGPFTQVAMTHQSGRGCRECCLEKYGYGVNGYYGTEKPSNLYIWVCDKRFVKVGLSKEVDRRLKTFKAQSHIDNVEIVKVVSGKAKVLYRLEQEILRESGLPRYEPIERFNGRTECLTIEALPTILEIVNQHQKENYHE